MAIDFLKEIIFASDVPVESRMISYKEKQGNLRKIAPRIYTTNMIDSPESIVKRNLIDILAWRLPGCVLSHRSAFLLRPTELGNLFITYKFTKRITDIPGITLNVMAGPEHTETDIRLGAADVYASSEERRMLEMMQQARIGKDGDIKKLPDEDIEKRLEEMIKVGGEERINRFRDQAREISETLGMQEEFKKLNKIISALLATHDSSVLSTPQGLFRAVGMPMDGSRIVLFDTLYDQLSSMYFVGL
ncbi:MAG: cell filamentation protein Fic, partial [Bacteroidales bacterium]|nr:cell filamentation protein Fic [Bacteroidales bacterium]